MISEEKYAKTKSMQHWYQIVAEDIFNWKLTQRIVQKSFFSLKGFSDAGTGIIRGSSPIWASQYANKSAAALDT